MRYAQIKSGQRLHLVYEAGEGTSPDKLTPRGHLSAPICDERTFAGRYRMSANNPLGNCCKNCRRVWHARRNQ